MSERWPEPVDAPDGQSYVVRFYRSGTMERFPSAGYSLYWLLAAVGWLAHLLVLRRRWTIRVTPWHNLPGRRYREVVASRSAAQDRAVVLRKAISSGLWRPGAGPPPHHEMTPVG
jgi:hypothetical protein